MGLTLQVDEEQGGYGYVLRVWNERFTATTELDGVVGCSLNGVANLPAADQYHLPSDSARRRVELPGLFRHPPD